MYFVMQKQNKYLITFCCRSETCRPVRPHSEQRLKLTPTPVNSHSTNDSYGRMTPVGL